MQAIITKYLPPTNTLGARVKATARAGSVTVQCGHDLSYKENHAFAARSLMEKLTWDDHSEICGNGGLPTGDHVWIMQRKE